MKRRRPYTPQFQRVIKNRRYHEDLGQIDYEAAVKAAAARQAETAGAVQSNAGPVAAADKPE